MEMLARLQVDFARLTLALTLPLSPSPSHSPLLTLTLTLTLSPSPSPSQPSPTPYHPHPRPHPHRNLLQADLAAHEHQRASSTEPSLFCVDVDTNLASSPAEASRAISELGRLRTALMHMHAVDDEAIRTGIAFVLRLSESRITPTTWRLAQQQQQPQPRSGDGDATSRAQLVHCLGVAGGMESRVSFELLVALSMASNAAGTLLLLNPNLTRDDAERILHLTTAVMMRVSRKSQAMRCLSLARELCAQLAGVEALAARADVSAEEERRYQTRMEPTSPGPHMTIVLTSPGPHAYLIWQRT